MDYCLSPSDKDWDELIDKSSYGTIFSKNIHLNFYKKKGEVYKYLFFDEKTKKFIACVPIVITQQKPNFTVYNGIIFNKELLDINNRSSKYALILKYSEEILKLILINHKKINFTLHPNYEDLRSFQWHNYNNSSGSKFKIKLRYTGILNLTNLTEQDLLNNMRSVRRREYKKNIETVSSDGKIEDLIKLYKLTFGRQNLNFDKNFYINLYEYCNYALKNNFARINFIKNKYGDIVSSVFFVYDNKSAYYLIGASDPKQRKNYPSAPAIIENILYFKKKQINFIDFVGINSPQRGDFKISFSPEIKPFFDVDLQ